MLETRLPTDEQVNFEGYTSFSLYRRKNPRAKRASGGITLLVKEQLFQGVTICKCDDDRFLWWKLDRNFFGLTDDIFVCSVYLPPYTSKTYVSESNKDRINCFITFRDQLSYFGKKGKIILYGDFYARTGNLDDFAEDVSWVSNCRLGVSERVHVVRGNNRDHTVNKFGLELIELCHGLKLRILNGRTKGDRLGDFSCFTPNGVSSIDYVVVSEELLTEIMGFVVSPLKDWSCHCLISFILNSGVRVSFKWNNIFKTKFLDELSSQQVVDRLNKFSNACLKGVSYDVDDAVKDLLDVVFSVAEATLPVKSGLSVLKKPKNSRRRKNKWFDKSCFELKREVLHFGKLTSKFPSDPIVGGTFFVIKKAYKKLVKTKKRSFKEFLLQNTASFEFDNPKDFSQPNIRQN